MISARLLAVPVKDPDVPVGFIVVGAVVLVLAALTLRLPKLRSRSGTSDHPGSAPPLVGSGRPGRITARVTSIMAMIVGIGFVIFGISRR